MHILTFTYTKYTLQFTLNLRKDRLSASLTPAGRVPYHYFTFQVSTCCLATWKNYTELITNGNWHQNKGLFIQIK